MEWPLWLHVVQAVLTVVFPCSLMVAYMLHQRAEKSGGPRGDQAWATALCIVGFVALIAIFALNWTSIAEVLIKAIG
ncbi:hypothetical protein HF209_30625 [Pseudomonas sp. WS 5096]|uniref:Uncharacterized protein n=1 Tax=Pseudomonas cremoris TaxID=2724178 RepID=A0ABR6TH52_9PSED|nr:hypothetical protein [Pseudomonas cremoris]MBC2385313.1 hypothetical protein [Pseudomonas cremoris]